MHTPIWTEPISNEITECGLCILENIHNKLRFIEFLSRTGLRDLHQFPEYAIQMAFKGLGNTTEPVFTYKLGAAHQTKNVMTFRYCH